MTPVTAISEAHPRPSHVDEAGGFLRRHVAGALATWIAIFAIGVPSLWLASSFADVLGIGPMVGPGYVDSFDVSCGTTATLIQSSHGQVAYEATVDSGAGASVLFGDSGVTSSVYGGTVAAGEKISGNVRSEYCIVASGSETIHVRALVATNPNGYMGAFRAWLAE